MSADDDHDGSFLREALSRSNGTQYRSFAGLAEARESGTGWAVLEGDDGGQIYAVFAADEVRCSPETLARLLSDIDARYWDDNTSTHLFFEAYADGAGVGGGMGGGLALQGGWIHPNLVAEGLDAAIRGVISGKADSLHHRHAEVTTVDIIGGPEAVAVTLHDYDQEWPARFREHERRIATALASAGAGARAAIEHIGSTSVPGLAAKPIIDIAVTVPDITAEEDYVAPLLAAGYELRVREPGHRMVRTQSRDVHVHLYEHGAPEVADYLLLRDHLRADDADRALYESTKRALLTQSWSDMNDYAEAKTDVIRAIKARARESRAGSFAPDSPSR